MEAYKMLTFHMILTWSVLQCLSVSLEDVFAVEKIKKSLTTRSSDQCTKDSYCKFFIHCMVD